MFCPRHFLDSGEPPRRAWLKQQAGRRGLHPDAGIARLAESDLVHLDESGRVSVAYPFSGAPSGHRVQLSGGVSVWAMCAIDALGIPQMVDADATITTADPASGDPIRVEARAGAWQWAPATVAVLLAQTDTCGPSAVCSCRFVNLYTRPESAQAWLDARPELAGRVLDQTVAVELAAELFAGLLREPDPVDLGA